MKKTYFIFALLGVAMLSFSANATEEVAPGEFLVKIKSQYTQMKRAQTEELLQSEVIDNLGESAGVVVVRRPVIERSEAAIARLAENRVVEWVEPNYIYRISASPNDVDYEKLWGMKNTGQVDSKGSTGVAGVDIDAEQAWDITTGSSDVVVAVIDTGIYNQHEDLADNMWVNVAEKNGAPGVDDDANGFVDDVYGWDFANNKPDGVDDHSHGTHCAGTIGGTGNNGKGVVGVNWKVRLMALKFLTAQGSGKTADAVKAIDYGIKMGAHIMSNSWGGGGASQALLEAIQRAEKAGILFVAAAGNDSSDNDKKPTYPASYDVTNVLTVAAISNKGALASFSNYGKTSVDVAAPGVAVYSSVAPTQGSTKKYEAYSGTSMATPHVAGVAALVLSHVSNASYQNLKDRIMKTSKPLAALKNKVVSGGLVSAYNALVNSLPGPNPNDPSNWQHSAASAATNHPYESNLDKTYTVTVPGAKKLALYFDRFEVERPFNGQVYDYVEFYDGAGKKVDTWSGSHTGEYSPVVDGDTIKMRFVTDNTVNEHGFDVSKAAVLQ